MEREKFDNLKNQVLERKQMLELFNISTVTLWKWTKNGIVRSHNMGSRKYFILDEILEDLRNNGGKLRKVHRGQEKNGRLKTETED